MKRIGGSTPIDDDADDDIDYDFSDRKVKARRVRLNVEKIPLIYTLEKRRVYTTIVSSTAVALLPEARNDNHYYWTFLWDPHDQHQLPRTDGHAGGTHITNIHHNLLELATYTLLGTTLICLFDTLNGQNRSFFSLDLIGSALEILLVTSTISVGYLHMNFFPVHLKLM